MKFYGEMRVQGGGPLDGSRFDALAYALAEIEETDPAIEGVDLTSSLAQGWVTASMTISEENLELAVAKLISAVRAAIYPHGDHAGGWQFLTETAGLSVHPMTDRAGMSAPDQLAPRQAVPGRLGPRPMAPQEAAPRPMAPQEAAPRPMAPVRPAPAPRPGRPVPPVLPPQPKAPARPDAPVSVWR